jgi:large subunit ribosomal protein L21
MPSYAVISDRGRQVIVRPGERVRLAVRDAAPGDRVVFDQVLLLGGEGSPLSGTPTVEGASVEGTVLRRGRAKKLIVFKFRRRKGYRRKQGHRQDFTEVRIDAVHAPGGGERAGKARERGE